MMQSLNFVAAGILLMAIGGWFISHDHKTVQKERARVSIEASKKNDTAQMARKRVDAAPVGGLLDKWFRD